VGEILDAVVHSPGWLVLLLVFLFPALEASTFLGLLVPGEAMVLLGGAVARYDRVTLWAVIVLAALGAVIGDQIGFVVGRRWGRAQVDKMQSGSKRARNVEKALDLIRRKGAGAVVTARWIAGVRTVVPAVAGMGDMRRTSFTLANLAGGVVWAIGCGVAGYLAGASFQALGDKLAIASAIICGVLLVAGIAWWLVRRHRRQQATATA
jgi:membrane-associated protein